jgi:hypothetical protein
MGSFLYYRNKRRAGETEMNITESSGAEDRGTGLPDRSVRPVIEHALTVYFDGNAELARTLIDRLLNENRNH